MMEADDIRLMSELLAADPASLVFLQLGEALRRKKQLDLAWRVATRGADRHPQRADAHDLVARVAADRSDFARARSEWETALELSPGHPAAQKGLGFLLFAQGYHADAERLLAAAATADPSDAALAGALDRLRAANSEYASERPTLAVEPRNSDGTVVTRVQDAARAPRSSRITQALAAPIPFAPTPVDARELFAEVLPDQTHAALLLDDQGFVVAGTYRAPDGRDVAADVGAQLSGVSDEAERAMKHLGLGAWRHISFEAQTASVAMAPSGSGVLLVAAPRSVPLGFVRRVLDRSLERAKKWLESGT
jgi:predicted regulator of Ras-like GTPase activity (Roadblock/LC7/MglB family)